MSEFSAKAYNHVAVTSQVQAGSPHQMVMLLFDATLDAIRQAAAQMHAGRIAEKGAMIGKAIRIIDEGLKLSLDLKAGGRIAGQLDSLYDYAVFRLLQANLRNDAKALGEVSALLTPLADAWRAIGREVVPAAGVTPAIATAVPSAAAAHDADGPVTYSAPNPSAARFFDGTSTGPLRRATYSV